MPVDVIREIKRRTAQKSTLRQMLATVREHLQVFHRLAGERWLTGDEENERAALQVREARLVASGEELDSRLDELGHAERGPARGGAAGRKE